MKIIIKKWGAIQESEYDLDKSMTVIYGDNNIGKSYAMQVMYLFLKNLIVFSIQSIRFPIIIFLSMKI